MVDINLLSIDQVAYSEYMMSLSEPSCIYILNSKNLEGRSILELNPQLAMMIVDRLLGGTGKAIISEMREITLIEQNIVRKTIERALDILNEGWSGIYPIDLEYDGFESNPQFVQIAPASEVAVIIFFEILIREMTYPLNICFPYYVLEPLMPKLTVQGWFAQTKRKVVEDSSEIIANRLTFSKVPLRAKLGEARISLKELVNMRKGDIITLNTKTTDDLPIIIKDKIKFFGQAGTVGSKRAVKIVHSVSKEEEKLYE
jgi:flagellar motor switch protein FliM